MEGQASNLGYYEVMGDYRLADEHRKAVQRVTADEIMAAAKKYLHLNNCSLAAYLPETALIAEPSPEAVESALRSVGSKTGLSDAKAPRPGSAKEAAKTSRTRREKSPVSAGRKDPTHRFVLANGIRVLCRHQDHRADGHRSRRLPGRDTARSQGEVRVCRFSPRASFSRARPPTPRTRSSAPSSGWAATIESFSGFDITGVYVNILRDHLDEALVVFRDVVRRPRFAPDKVEQEKKRLLEELAKRHDHPVYYSIDHLFSRMFGNHPYAHPFIGDESQLRSLNAADCEEQHRRSFEPGNTVVVFVGDIDAARAREAAERMFGDVDAGPAFLPSTSSRATSRPTPVSTSSREKNSTRRSGLSGSSRRRCSRGKRRVFASSTGS